MPKTDRLEKKTRMTANFRAPTGGIGKLFAIGRHNSPGTRNRHPMNIITSAHSAVSPINRRIKNVLKLLFAVAVLSSLALAPKAHAYVNDAENQRLFNDMQLATGILGVAHVTATMNSATFDGICPVVNGTGKAIPGAYALQYTYRWTSSLDDGSYATQVSLFFDNNGNLTDLQVKTPSTFFPPFAGSSMVVSMLAEAIRSEIEKNGTRSDRIVLEGLLASRDTKKLCLFLLQLNQRASLAMR